MGVVVCSRNPTAREALGRNPGSPASLISESRDKETLSQKRNQSWKCLRRLVSVLHIQSLRMCLFVGPFAFVHFKAESHYTAKAGIQLWVSSQLLKVWGYTRVPPQSVDLSMSLWVRVYVHVCMSMCVCMCVWTCAWVCVCMHLSVHCVSVRSVRVRALIHECACVCACRWVYL